MSRPRRRRAQDGAATLLVVALAGVLLFVGSGLAVVGGAVVSQRHAQSAADLAALAAARSLADGTDACAMAAEVASANGGRLATCRDAGREVLVEVVVRGPRALGRRIDVTASARAGPGGYGP